MSIPKLTYDETQFIVAVIEDIAQGKMTNEEIMEKHGLSWNEFIPIFRLSEPALCAKAEADVLRRTLEYYFAALKTKSTTTNE